jgi:hypothetical protein
MSEFRQITDAEELEGKTIARVVTDENRDDDGQALVIFSDGSYTVFSPCLSYDEKPCIWIDEKPKFSYKFKHGIASPAEIAADRQLAELEERKMQERIAQQDRAEYERLKAMFESESDHHEKGHWAMSFPDLLTFELVVSMATAEATGLGRPMVVSHSPGAWHVRNAGAPALTGFVDVATIMPGAGAGESSTVFAPGQAKDAEQPWPEQDQRRWRGHRMLNCEVAIADRNVSRTGIRAAVEDRRLPTAPRTTRRYVAGRVTGTT